jgi:hypothetical protein
LVNADEKAVPNSRLSSSSPTSSGTGNDKITIDPSKGGAISPKATKESKALEVESGFWVWDGITRVLEVDLFSAAWEVRHGAAMAMRELLKVQGRCGGMRGLCYSFTSFALAQSFQIICLAMTTKLLTKSGAMIWRLNSFAYLF